MVLKKIGEYTTNILVNGVQEESFAQNDNSDYDINISSNAPNQKSLNTNSVSDVGLGSNQSIVVLNGAEASEIIIDFKFYDDNDDAPDFKIKEDGNTIYDSESPNPFPRTYTYSNTNYSGEKIVCKQYNNSSSGSFDYDVTQKVSIDNSISVSGVNKS